MFRDVLYKFAVLDIPNKRDVINDELVYLTLLFEQTCAAKNIQYRKILDDEIKDLVRSSETEDQYLNRIYNKPPILLLDEYDVPLQTAYVENYYEKWLALH